MNLDAFGEEVEERLADFGLVGDALEEPIWAGQSNSSLFAFLATGGWGRVSAFFDFAPGTSSLATSSNSSTDRVILPTSGKVKDVIDESRLVFGCRRGTFLHFNRAPASTPPADLRRFFFHHFRIPDDGVEGSAQFMRHVGEEL